MDGFEIDRAGVFTLAELQELSTLQPLSRLSVTKVLRGEAKVLQFHAHPKYLQHEYVIYA